MSEASLLVRMLAATATSTTLAVDTVYLVPHQDDETTLAAAVLDETRQGKRVAVMLTTRGDASNARTNPLLTGPLGYTPTQREFSEARDREFLECVRRLGAEPVLLPWEEREPDGGSVVGNIVARVKSMFPSSVALRATGPTDYHHDHRACGLAVQTLWEEGWGTDHRMLLASTFLDLAPSGITMQKWGQHGDFTAHHAWSYIHQDIAHGWWGIGYISAKPSLDHFLDVDGAAYWHPPFVADPNFPGLAYVGTGAGSQAATSSNPATPTGQVGDLGIRILGNKPYSSVLTTPSGWSQLGTITNGSVASGNDTGSVRITSWQQTATSTAAMSGSSTGSPAAAQVVGRAMRFSKAELSSWDVQSIEFARTSETGQVSSASTAVPSANFFQAGDRFVIGVALKSDAINHTSQVLTIGGTTLSITWDTKFTGTSGSDMALYTGQGEILSGSSPSGAAVEYSASCNNNNAAAALSIVRVREVQGIVT